MSRIHLLLLLLLAPLFARAEALDAKDYAVSPPDLFIVNGVLVGPVQPAADSLGASVKLEGKTLTVIRGDVRFTCTLNSTAAGVGDTRLTLAKAPFLAGNRTYVPFAPLVRAFHGTLVVDTTGGYTIVTLPDRKNPLHYPLIPLSLWRETFGCASNALYVINLDGSGLRRIVCNAGSIQSPAFSPDGTRLVYIRHGSLCLRHVDQADEVRLVPDDGNAYRSPCFTPDGNYILFQRVIVDLKNVPGARAEQIWRINPDGTDKRLLGTGVRTGISPDGRTIACTVQTAGAVEMRLIEIDGGRQRSLGEGKNPVFSPDGRNILYLKTFLVEKKPIDLLVSRPLDSGPEVSPPAPTKETPGERDGQFSPDGKRIVAPAKGLTIMGADRRGATQLTTTQYDSAPVFTADGQTIVFLRGSNRLPFSLEDDEDSDIFLNNSLVSIKPDGTEEMDIYDEMNVGEFAVAPNSRQIVFTGDSTPPPDDETDLKETEPAYTFEDVQGYVTELVPLIEEIAGRKFTTVPSVRLVKRRQLVPILAKESAPTIRRLFHNDEMDVDTLARQAAKSAAPALLGKYGVKEHTLFLLPGNLEPIVRAIHISSMHREGLIKLIIAHELTHALQDQVIGLEGQDAKANSAEKILAQSAVAEGFAVYVQDNVAEKLKLNSTAREMARMLAIAVTPSAPSVFVRQNGSAQTFREVYLGGRDFIDWHAQREGIETVWKILADPPTKTRVILHPDQYAPAVAAAEVDYIPVVMEAALQLGVRKAKLFALELGEITLREFFSILEMPARDSLADGIEQIYFTAGPKAEDTSAMVMLAKFRDQAQIQPLVTEIEKKSLEQFLEGKLDGDKQGPLEGITADYTRKRMIAHGSRKDMIVSVARGKLLILLCLENFILPDAQLVTIIDEAFTRARALESSATPPADPNRQPDVQ